MPQQQLASLSESEAAPDPSVDFLIGQVQELAGIDRERNRHADTRAAGLAVVANGLLAIAATLATKIREFSVASTIDDILPFAYGASLLFLLAAAVCAALALRITAKPALPLSRIAAYRHRSVQETETGVLRREALESWVRGVANERLTYDDKTMHLVRGFRFLLAGLAVLAVVAATLAAGGS